jgi:bis(5'-adenosyl)-triphosphatase
VTTNSFEMTSAIKFGPFSVADQIFHVSRSRLSFALVNLKPLLPGHVLVCPARRVPRISQLTPDETADLFLSVQRVSRTIERVYNASALNVAIQDGVDAGQSVPHVHVHIIPRKLDDLKEQGGGDKIYAMMDSDDGNVGKAFLQMQQQLSQRANYQTFTAAPDSDRKPRTPEEMSKEASWLITEMIKDDLTLGRAADPQTSLENAAA